MSSASRRKIAADGELSAAAGAMGLIRVELDKILLSDDYVDPAIADALKQALYYFETLELERLRGDVDGSIFYALALGTELRDLGISLHPAVRGTSRGGRKGALTTNSERALKPSQRARIKSVFDKARAGGANVTEAAKRAAESCTCSTKTVQRIIKGHR